MILKGRRSKKTYNVPGYVKGKYDSLKAVFRAHSVEGLMTYEAFMASKYLRFWPGKMDISASLYRFLVCVRIFRVRPSYYQYNVAGAVHSVEPESSLM